MPRTEVIVFRRLATARGALIATSAVGLVIVLLTVVTLQDSAARLQADGWVGDSAKVAFAPSVDRAAPGPFSVGRRSVDITRADDESFEALVLYPAAPEQGGPPDAPVDDAPVALEGAPFAAIVFGHGFLQQPDRYAGLLAHLAGWGYVVVAPSSHTGLTADHAGFAADLSATLAWLEEAGGGDVPEPSNSGPEPAQEPTPDPTPNPEADSAWLAGRVDGTRLGLAGHSMGGGAALLAAASDPRVAAWLVMAPSETSPSAVAAMVDVAAPGVVLAGDEDDITPLADHARPIFDAGTSPRLLALLRGGSHCGFQDDPFPVGCQEGSLPWAEQLALTRGWLVAFFDLHLGVVDAVDEEGQGGGDDGLGELSPDRFGWSSASWRDVWGPEASADPVVNVEVEVGLTVHAAPVVARGHGIARAEYGLRRGDGGARAKSAEVDVEPGAWPVLGERMRTPPLAAGEAYTGTIEVAVPLRDAGSLGPDADEAIVSAWIDDGLAGRARAWAPLRVTRAGAEAAVGRVWLPWLERELRR